MVFMKGRAPYAIENRMSGPVLVRQARRIWINVKGLLLGVSPDA